MKNKRRQQVGLRTANSRPDNPGSGRPQASVPEEDRSNPAIGAGQSQPNSKEKLQNLLPEINALAQKVGGMKRLAELTNTLAQGKE